MELRTQAKRLLPDVAFLVTPTVGRSYTCAELYADPIATNNNIGYYTYPISPLDLCALALPASIRADGLAFGISLVAPARNDGILRVAETRFQQHAGLLPGVLARRETAAAHRDGVPA